MTKDNFSGMWNGSFEWLNIKESTPELDPVEVAALMAEGKTESEARKELSKVGFFQSRTVTFDKAPGKDQAITVLYRKTP